MSTQTEVDHEFDMDVLRYVTSIYEDTGLEVTVQFGNAGGRFIELLSVRDSTGVNLNYRRIISDPIKLPTYFYDVDSFRAYIDQFLPESY